MSIPDLKSITATIRGEVPDAMALLAAIGEFASRRDDIADIVPKCWVDWIESRFIDPLWNPRFWEAVASKECYLYTKYSRRFFPMEGNADWKEVSQACNKSNYPEFGNAQHSNFEKVRNIKLHTNYGMIPQLDLAKITSEIESVFRVIELAIALRDRDLQCKLWYSVATNYELCHIVVKTDRGRQLTRIVWDSDRDLIAAGLFWTMYQLAHEEQTCAAPTESSRFVFTLDEINRLDFLNGLPVDTTPWIINANRNGNNVMNCCPFYLKGRRSVATPKDAEARIRAITMGCFDGFSRFEGAALTGSLLMQVLGNNELLHSAKPVTDSDGAIIIYPHESTERALPVDSESFEARSRLYYPREGDMSSDIDVAVSRVSNKEFIKIADEMVELLSKNLGSAVTLKHDCTQSGVRYHISHPRLLIKIEIFRTPQTLMKLVTGFHVAPVRCYWNFTDWRMTRSCAAALITGVGENFNWFSSNKVPTDVILKVAQRGITVCLNQKELECLSKFLERSERWGYGFNKITEFTGAFSPDHPFFRVDALPLGVRMGLEKIPAAVGNWKMNCYKLARQLKWRNRDFVRYCEVDNTYRVAMPPRLF